MISQYRLDRENSKLSSDLSGEKPLYLYWPEDKSILLYSDSISELLNDIRVVKPLKVNDEGISFLLQSGVVPPPLTAYQDIYILGIGDQALVSVADRNIHVEFRHEFPFMNANRLTPDEMIPDEEEIIRMLANATINRIDKSRPSFLFHSAGKDSNSIALALAEFGWQDKVTLVTHKSEGGGDESEISADIAKTLGFKHQVLKEMDIFTKGQATEIDNFFVNSPFPCVDDITLAYPLYSSQFNELKNSNLIFGDGNDSYMGSPPSKRQCIMQRHSRYTSKLHFLRSLIHSESKINAVIRTPAEWFGLSGLNYKDSRLLCEDVTSVYPYWKSESIKRKCWDVFDFNTDIYSTRTITERMIRKLFNFGEANSSKVVLPFTDHQVTDYFSKISEKYLFDRNTSRNKIILRDILKRRIGLDSDALGKMGWSYNVSNVLRCNWDLMMTQVYSCELWRKNGLYKVINRLKVAMEKDSKNSALPARLIYRIYLISAWHNNCRYLKLNE